MRKEEFKKKNIILVCSQSSLNSSRLIMVFSAVPISTYISLDISLGILLASIGHSQFENGEDPLPMTTVVPTVYFQDSKQTK